MLCTKELMYDWCRGNLVFKAQDCIVDSDHRDEIGQVKMLTVRGCSS